MNKDQLAGKAKNLSGKIQQDVGKMVGNKNQQAAGIAKQISGTVQEGVGNVKSAVKSLSKKR